jgi:hypothetical protein
MRRVTAVAVLMGLIGCATMQVSTPGRAMIPAEGTDYGAVFTAAMRAVRNADFVLNDSDRESGFIYATKGANPLITETKNLQLSIQVIEEEGSFVVDLKSNLVGQLVAYGATRTVVEEYCKELVKLIPEATVTIDGKAWAP